MRPDAQDERRRIFEDVSRHTLIGLRYLPPIARRLRHSRDLGEPFDFITWFDYAPEHERDFDALLAELRASEEWTYVEREIDIRLVSGRLRSSTGAHVSGHGSAGPIGGSPGRLGSM